MAEYKRRDMPEDMIVRISPGRNTITVQECSANGVVSYREIDPIEFYFALNGSCISNVYQRSGFLPEHCLHISMNAEERHYVIWNSELRADVIYRDTEYRSFPLPRLIFGLRVLGNGKVADCSMGVVADETPTEDTPMFFYPFSNVYEDDRVCTGNNVLPRYKKLSALKNFPRYLLGLPVVFAKKKSPSTMENALSARVRSFTKGCDYDVCLSRDFLHAGDRVLFIDDFLANGNAALGMLELVGQAGASLAGMGFLIEKAFQPGGAMLREKGIRVESLARIESLDGGRIVFAR